MEEERSIALHQLMVNEGLIPSSEEEERRQSVVYELRKIVLAWIKRVAWQRRLTKQQIAATSATVLTNGSYGLGEDFFIVLCNMLKDSPEVSEIHCVRDAKAPLMRFKFDGIPVDLPYAQLKVLSVPEDVDVLNPFFLRDMDEASWKSLSGVCANKCILQLLPDVESFQSLLRCVKLWAKRRGVYGNLHGFLGAVHLAILAAFVCQSHPGASLSALVSEFFKTFAFWPWPTPVVLQDGISPVPGDASEIRSFMPIQLPCTPYEYCHSNITKSTFYKIRAEFLRAHNLTRDLLRLGFDWSGIFEPFPYSKKYTQFVKIFLSAPDQDKLGDWVGWVKSRFRSLIVKLEEVKGLCDPNPTEYVDTGIAEANVVFYCGLQPGKTNSLDIESVGMDFLKNINNGSQGSCGRMELSIVQASELPKVEQVEGRRGKGWKASWRIPRYTHQGTPVYSQHLPHYFLGYGANHEAPAGFSATG
ncbi:nuclear poly(A) polymerase 3 isoform X2 [Tripterygium wilfordii]|uniref:nuclear poly(A) polymerase 3 isoform X2 n=1 Tax=Tripterygium wilfordii TaxID=458696 RepID=UPI0018F844ED|nr:nuclear poly(A) polymerase 3 isoform X2 [Tripterygium wilfordii]